jgi:hypothetical protein
LTDAKLGVKAILKKAKELAKEIPNAWYCDQFDNLANQRVSACWGGAPCLHNEDWKRICILAKALSLIWPNSYVDILGFWVLGFGFWVLGFGFWVLGFGFWVLGFGFCCLGF